MAQADQHSNNWYILVAGLPVADDSHTLASGLSIRALKSPLTVFDLAAAGASGFRAWATLEPFAAACVSEIESAKDAATAPGYDALNRAWLVSTLLSIRGFSNHISVACSAYTWRTVAGHQARTSGVFHEQFRDEGIDAAIHNSKRALPPFKGDLLDYHTKLLELPDTRASEVTAADAQWVRDHFDGFNLLAADSEPFRFALEAVSDWRFQRDARAAVARIWAGIEALFAISSELVYRISLLSAALLEPRGESRRERFHAVRKLYGRRSKAVHGEPMKQEALDAALLGSYELLRELVLHSVSAGRTPTKADLDDAVFC